MNSLAGLSGLTPILMIVIFAYLYAMGGRDEPRANLVKTFLLGVIGLFVGVFVGFPMRLLDARSVMPFADALLASIVFATIPGELVKLVIVNYYCQRLRSFKSLPAGIIYGGVAALGFTLADHITFAAPELWFVSTVRVLIAAPLHVITGGVMGYALAQRMFVRDSRWTIAKGWALGVATHSIFNLLWLTAGLYRANHGTSWIILNGFPIIAIGLVVILGGWITRKLRQTRLAQLLQVASHAPIESVTEPTFLQRLKEAADRSDESE